MRSWERGICLGCGKDTRIKEGLCRPCTRHQHGREEEVGRSARSPQVLAGDPFEDCNVDAPPSSRLYHGESIRDDI